MSTFPWTVELSTASRQVQPLRNEGDVSLCAMRMGDKIYGIETTRVLEVLARTDRTSRRGTGMGMQARHDLRHVPLAPGFIAGIIPYRGEVLTTLSLRAVLGEGQERPGGCVLVLDDEEAGERFGLMVDAVIGVLSVQKEMLEATPCTVDSRTKALLDGIYKTNLGLIARIDPERLNPTRLAATGLFESVGR